VSKRNEIVGRGNISKEMRARPICLRALGGETLLRENSLAAKWVERKCIESRKVGGKDFKL